MPPCEVRTQAVQDISNESINVSLYTAVVVTCRFCCEWQFEGLVDLISWCVDLCHTSGKRTD